MNLAFNNLKLIESKGSKLQTVPLPPFDSQPNPEPEHESDRKLGFN